MLLNRIDKTASKLAATLAQLRLERGISQLQLADEAGVKASVVHRAERGMDARLSTWIKLFDGLGYRLLFETTETCEEAGALLAEEAERRKERRLAGLLASKNLA